MENSQFNLVKGLLYGQAIGDALGLGCEFLSKQKVLEYYPNGFSDYTQIVQDAHRSRWQKGEWTDDTDQFICLLESYIENKNAFDLNDIAKRLYNWSKEEGMGIGKLTHNVFKFPGYINQPQKAAELAWKMTQKKAAPNGALMRNGVIALAYYDDIENALFYAEEICKLTHFDPRCIDSCRIHTILLVSLLKNERLTLEEVLERSKLKDKRSELFIKENLNQDYTTFKLDDEFELGYTFKALLCALWGYFYASSFESGLLKIINEGGDADTNGCVLGTILGAKFGFEQIPSRYINDLKDYKKIDLLSENFNH